MRDRGVGCLPVVDEGRLVGMLTESIFLGESFSLIEAELARAQESNGGSWREEERSPATDHPWGGAERVVASLTGSSPGTTLLVVGGLHGNEPAGLVAGRRVVEHLKRTDAVLRGSLVVMTGNRQALAKKSALSGSGHESPLGGQHLERLKTRHHHELSRENQGSSRWPLCSNRSWMRPPVTCSIWICTAPPARRIPSP